MCPVEKWFIFCDQHFFNRRICCTAIMKSDFKIVINPFYNCFCVLPVELIVILISFSNQTARLRSVSQNSPDASEKSCSISMLKFLQV